MGQRSVLPTPDLGPFSFIKKDTASLPPVSIPPPSVWIPKNFYLADLRRPITLEECQTRPLDLAFSKDESGHYKYNTIVWSWPKKSAKSTVIAAVCDYVAMTKPMSSIKLIANDLKQADSRVGFYLRGNLKASPRKNQVKISLSGYTITYLNGSRVEMVPIDPAGEAGGNDDLIVYSELWGWRNKSHQKMWTEMTLSPNKFATSQRWIDTYAGYAGESPILEQLYDVGVRQGVQVWPDLEVYINEDARTLCVWVTEHLLPWQTDDVGRAYYAEQARTLTPNEYRRIHHNQWVSSQSVFIEKEWWNACEDLTVPEPTKDEPWIVALDAGVSNDTFAVVAVARHPELKDHTVVRYAKSWKPPLGKKIDYQGTEDNPGPELELRRLLSVHNVVEVAYDPMQLEDMAGRLRREGKAWFRPFTQGMPRLIADSQLRSRILEKRVHHDGQEDLRKHVLNANAEVDPEEHKIRIVKRANVLKVDLVVAMSMADYECMRLNL